MTNVEKLKTVTQEEADKKRRFPILDIVANRAEIREISEEAVVYLADVYPELAALKEQQYWEVVPRISIELLKETFNFLSQNRGEGNSAEYKLGEFLTCCIEYGTTADAEKDGTLNPCIHIGSEMYYDNETFQNNGLTYERAQFDFTDGTLEALCTAVVNNLKNRVVIGSWQAVLFIFTAFMRIAKQYLIRHRDDTDYGVEINLADIVDLNIDRYDGDSGDEYVIQISPGQIAKLNFAKSDEKTETSH